MERRVEEVRNNRKEAQKIHKELLERPIPGLASNMSCFEIQELAKKRVAGSIPEPVLTRAGKCISTCSDPGPSTNTHPVAMRCLPRHRSL